ncbi:hypothetical protein BD410DRAFT_334789 [Rickenella mellea]|uniref:Uncharacterized protein n=1 Tax=Rickenella mellea TaxID=50990 RepID=A0A4Y7QKJ5_9AGAM|nr:hypothetical protein BD410DRAFT_334789 [Rickenella mellea]
MTTTSLFLLIPLDTPSTRLIYYPTIKARHHHHYHHHSVPQRTERAVLPLSSTSTPFTLQLQPFCAYAMLCMHTLSLPREPTHYLPLSSSQPAINYTRASSVSVSQMAEMTQMALGIATRSHMDGRKKKETISTTERNQISKNASTGLDLGALRRSPFMFPQTIRSIRVIRSVGSHFRIPQSIRHMTYVITHTVK